MSTERSAQPLARRPNNSQTLDTRLFTIVAVVVVALLILLCANLAFQYLNYSVGISRVRSEPGAMNHAALMAYSRAWDFAVVKTSALFLAFLLVFIGCLYVLRAAETNFSASLERSGLKAALSLTSPGLILALTGSVLIGVVLFTKSAVEYTDNRSLQPAELPAVPSAPTQGTGTPLN